MAYPHDQRHLGLPPRPAAGTCETMSQFSRPMRDNVRKTVSGWPVLFRSGEKQASNSRNNPSVAEVVDACDH
ncbi:hypothetical protein ASPBRDRAFT_124149 [Aspergillus brasiliensis CBS 101740]|uniref:Uncharacterized protein n=1 Tax=Aspergillus brasiliensis (strain CBS 101740 / IMI 381727 / IBT 21946) TaxID=767769 RepID=A0A1L9ULK5_ASPBC|nr:hypothetical protein ASPBRDRAFT_124149 [Aspergillus brasiliensis CBS 101740]